MPQSIDDLFVERLPAVLRFAGVLTGDRQLAEDIVRDVLLKAYRQWDRISALDHPEAYLRRMIVNEYLSWRRKWARLIPRAEVDDGRTVPDLAVAHADHDRLAGPLAALAPRQRAVIVLRYYLGQSDADVAEVLGCSTGTVRGYASRTLAALRIDLAENDRIDVGGFTITGGGI